MDRRLYSSDNDYLRSIGYEVFTDDPLIGDIPAKLDYERVVGFVFALSDKDRKADQHRGHWSLWGFDLI